MTDFLSELSNRAKVYDALVPLLQKCVEREGSHQIVDLGSGSGTYWPRIIAGLEGRSCPVEVTLTDLFPHDIQSSHARIKVMDLPLDYRKGFSHLPGLKTMFLSLHHNDPESVKRLLLEFQGQREHVLFVEGQQRKWSYLIPMLLSPINLLILTPFIRPFRWDRILFNYLIPILPLAVLWDGIVSVLRTYNIQDIGAILFEDADEQYFWEMSSVGTGPFKLLYLYGRPEQNTD